MKGYAALTWRQKTGIAVDVNFIEENGKANAFLENVHSHEIIHIVYISGVYFEPSSRIREG